MGLAVASLFGESTLHNTAFAALVAVISGHRGTVWGWKVLGHRVCSLEKDSVGVRAWGRLLPAGSKHAVYSCVWFFVFSPLSSPDGCPAEGGLLREGSAVCVLTFLSLAFLQCLFSHSSTTTRLCLSPETSQSNCIAPAIPRFKKKVS